MVDTTFAKLTHLRKPEKEISEEKRYDD